MIANQLERSRADGAGYGGCVATRKQPADGADARLDDRGYDALIVVSFGGPEGLTT